MGMPCSSERWQQMRRGWEEEADKEKRTRGEMAAWSGEKEEVAYGWKMEEWKRDAGGGNWEKDTALHPQSFVGLHKYWVHGWVAGSQVNMTYEYCRSHSLASCPPQLLMSGAELVQLSLEALISNTCENEWETQTDGLTCIKKEKRG